MKEFYKVCKTTKQVNSFLRLIGIGEALDNDTTAEEFKTMLKKYRDDSVQYEFTAPNGSYYDVTIYDDLTVHVIKYSKVEYLKRLKEQENG